MAEESEEGLDLQTLFDRMRHICEALEEKKLKLEDGVKLYEEGLAIQKQIKARLDAADKRIVELVKEDGSIEPCVPQPRQR